MKKIVLLTLALAFSLSSCNTEEKEARPYEAFSGKVVAVTDGDTIQVMREGKAARVRLWGIDAPEKKQPFGEKAKQFTSSKVFGLIVDVRVLDTDRYGRTVGLVMGPDAVGSLNEQMVKYGFAWCYRQYAKGPAGDFLLELEKEARAEKRGLWADANPVAPWEFRRTK